MGKFEPQSRDLLAVQALRPELAPGPYFEELSRSFSAAGSVGDAIVSRASQRYLCNYLDHWAKIIPAKLALISSPDEWRIKRLLDETKTKLRKPKVRVNVTINSKNTFELRCEAVVNPNELRAAGCTENEWHDATDFKSLVGCSLVYLRSNAYPARPDFDVSDVMWHEQKSVFLEFVSSVIRLLRISVDAEVENWPELDEQGNLVVYDSHYRAKRLANEQLAKARHLRDEAYVNYQKMLLSTGVEEPTLIAAVAERTNTGTALLTIVQSVTGRPILSKKLRAYDQALENITRMEEVLRFCEAVLHGK